MAFSHSGRVVFRKLCPETGKLAMWKALENSDASKFALSYGGMFRLYVGHNGNVD
jgi:hypothetical protein